MDSLAFDFRGIAILKHFHAAIALAVLTGTLAPASAHNIDINQASNTSVSAIIVADEAEIGNRSQVWLGALFGGKLYFRDAANAWRLSNGSYPPAVDDLTLGPVNAIAAVSAFDVSQLPGLELYLAYGPNAVSASATPGHIRRILGVSSTGAADPSAAIDVTRLPMGDGKLSRAPVRGQIWACSNLTGGGGASKDGPWIRADGTYDLTAKLSVGGNVKWSGTFAATLSGDRRVIGGNGLPSHGTGTYPIGSSDPAFEYDRNPNAIRNQTVSLTLPANPQIAAGASCLPPGAIGVLTSGVVFFNGLDAESRDAVAHEVQDRCQGHPERNGSYHYHNISNCLKEKPADAAHSPLVGYAYDGFGMYGRYGEGGKLLTNADLDECHGHAHEIDWDRKPVSMYHYHATWEYPYTMGCYRGTPARPVGL